MRPAETISFGFVVLLAICTLIAQTHPFLLWTHTWQFAVGAILGAALLAVRAFVVRFGERGEAYVRLGAVGGAAMAANLAYAAYVVGQPQRIQATPGQMFRPPHSVGTVLRFPPVNARDLLAGHSPDTVSIVAQNVITLPEGHTVRSGPYVFHALSGPLAFVSAASTAGEPVTITQPGGAAFLSPYLTFAALEGGQPQDAFALPALHRTVRVAYYSGIPSRGIDIPFLVVAIAEENGGLLYHGVALSGKPLVKSGVRLTFLLGTYPVVMLSSAPPIVPFVIGAGLVGIGLLGYVLTTLRRDRP